jgi:hypothetical protein
MRQQRRINPLCRLFRLITPGRNPKAEGKSDDESTTRNHTAINGLLPTLLDKASPLTPAMPGAVHLLHPKLLEFHPTLLPMGLLSPVQHQKNTDFRPANPRIRGEKPRFPPINPEFRATNPRIGGKVFAPPALGIRLWTPKRGKRAVNGWTGVVSPPDGLLIHNAADKPIISIMTHLISAATRPPP